jgi:hypothetical protein
MRLEVESDIAVVAIVHSSLTRSMPLAIRLILLSPKLNKHWRWAS